MFKIARDIGGMTVDELAERITALEVMKWDRFYSAEARAIKREQDKASRR